MIEPGGFDKKDKFRKEMLPIADKIYKKWFCGCKSIKRFDNKKDKRHILDRNFHIDTVLTLKNDMIVTLQEKFRENEWYKKYQYTLEYYNNPRTKEEGEYFKLCTDFYVYGWATIDKKDFEELILFKTLDMKLLYLNGKLKVYLQDNKKWSKASFFIFFDRFDKPLWENIIYKRYKREGKVEKKKGIFLFDGKGN